MDKCARPRPRPHPHACPHLRPARPSGTPYMQFLVYGIPSKASSLEVLDSQLSEQLAALAAEGPAPEELRRYKKVRHGGCFCVCMCVCVCVGGYVGGWVGGV